MIEIGTYQVSEKVSALRIVVGSFFDFSSSTGSWKTRERNISYKWDKKKYFYPISKFYKYMHTLKTRTQVPKIEVDKSNDG